MRAVEPDGFLVVAEVYRRAFDFVAPVAPEPWKGAIDAVVAVDLLGYEPGVVADAIEFMGGGKATMTPVPNDGNFPGGVRFVAPGYWAATGA